MQYKCARAIKVEKIDSHLIRKTFADYRRKGLTAEQWQEEMFNEINLMKQAAHIINVPQVVNVNNYHYDMTYCGNMLESITLKRLIDIKNMERDLIHYGEIYHNDMKWQNILLWEDKLYLIDFGRATLKQPGFPYLTYLDLATLKHDRGHQNYIKYLDKHINKIHLQTNAHGGGMSYYALNDNKGIRKWDERWQILKDIADYKDKRILDLGCNQGLFTTSIAKECKPRFVLGADASEDILQAANAYALKIQANSYFKHVNIAEGDRRNPHFEHTKNWHKELGYNWDIVSALSLYHWVANKQDLLEYLSRFPCVIIECHSDKELAEIGSYFCNKKYKMIVVNSGSDEFYDRPLIKFVRKT